MALDIGIDRQDVSLGDIVGIGISHMTRVRGLAGVGADHGNSASTSGHGMLVKRRLTTDVPDDLAIICPMSSSTCFESPYGSKGIIGWSSSRGRYSGTNAAGSCAQPMPNALDEDTNRRTRCSAAAIITLKVLLTLFSNVSSGSALVGPGTAPM